MLQLPCTKNWKELCLKPIVKFDIKTKPKLCMLAFTSKASSMSAMLRVIGSWALTLVALLCFTTFWSVIRPREGDFPSREVERGRTLRLVLLCPNSRSICCSSEISASSASAARLANSRRFLRLRAFLLSGTCPGEKGRKSISK